MLTRVGFHTESPHHVMRFDLRPRAFSRSRFGISGLTAPLLLVWAAAAAPSPLAVPDQLAPLPAKAVQFDGYLEDYIQNSITHWNKGVVPYGGFVQMFRTGR